MQCLAVEKLMQAQARTGSLLSIGLEPSNDYLPKGWDTTIEGHEQFLRTIIDATDGIACAYKVNLAFFEALGSPGWALLERVRSMVSGDVALIADGKRGDIGTSAERYATATFDQLGFDAATVNPLMGRDAVEPFLAHTDRLTLVLALTSNPGAADFLAQSALWHRIIEKSMAWSGAGANAGFVVGATQADHLAEARARAGDRVILVPGIGAQGGDLERAIRDGCAPGPEARMIVHLTRGVLPGPGDAARDPGAVIREKTMAWNARILAARGKAGGG